MQDRDYESKYMNRYSMEYQIRQMECWIRSIQTQIDVLKAIMERTDADVSK